MAREARLIRWRIRAGLETESDSESVRGVLSTVRPCSIVCACALNRLSRPCERQIASLGRPDLLSAYHSYLSVNEPHTVAVRRLCKDSATFAQGPDSGLAGQVRLDATVAGLSRARLEDVTTR